MGKETEFIGEDSPSFNQRNQANQSNDYHDKQF